MPVIPLEPLERVGERSVIGVLRVAIKSAKLADDFNLAIPTFELVLHFLNENNRQVRKASAGSLSVRR